MLTGHPCSSKRQLPLKLAALVIVVPLGDGISPSAEPPRPLIMRVVGRWRLVSSRLVPSVSLISSLLRYNNVGVLRDTSLVRMTLRIQGLMSK